MPLFDAHYSHILIAPALAIWIVLVSRPPALRSLAWATWAAGALLAVNDVSDLIVRRSFPENTYFQLEALITALIVWPVLLALVVILLVSNEEASGGPPTGQRMRGAAVVLLPLLLIGTYLTIRAIVALLALAGGGR